ncbi:unnamed protein product, partial [Prunus brigantina]
LLSSHRPTLEDLWNLFVAKRRKEQYHLSMYSRLYRTICELDGILLKYFVVFLHLIFYCQPMDKLT